MRRFLLALGLAMFVAGSILGNATFTLASSGYPLSFAIAQWVGALFGSLAIGALVLLLVYGLIAALSGLVVTIFISQKRQGPRSE